MGLNLEYYINEDIFVYLKGDFVKDYFKSEFQTHFGKRGVITNTKNSFWISLVIKKNFLINKK